MHIPQKKRIIGTISVPGDKSISHRAVILSSLSTGTCVFDNMLLGADCLSTIQVFREMGIDISIAGTTVTIKGRGLHGLTKPKSVLDVGNSGTTIRLLSGILAGQAFDAILSGDASLNARPMNRIIEPLQLMGAKIVGSGTTGTAPLTITGQPLSGIIFQENKGSAQVKSAVLLAGMYAKGRTTVIEVRPSRDHTERMFRLFQAPFQKENNRLKIDHTDMLLATSNIIPNDISSAAFFIVAALILKDSEIRLPNVGINPTRMGIINILKRMGADIEIEQTADDYEPIGTITVRSSSLRGVDIDPSEIPFIIDELPIVMIAACCAEGRTSIRGAHELRVKETDRIHSMTSGLRTLGVPIQETEDGAIIDGVESIQGGVTVDSYHDHRTAMSFAVLAAKTMEGITIRNANCVAISYPTFYETLATFTHT